MMTCREAHRMVIRRLDVRLSPGQRLGLRLHLLICAACRGFDRQMAFLRKACRQFPGNQ